MSEGDDEADGLAPLERGAGGPHRVALSLGSNLGDREAWLGRALEELETIGHVVARSSWIETEPVGGPAGQGRFLNGAVVLETALDPRALLGELKAIEERVGRRATERWGPREIDLDLLLYDDRVVSEQGLEIPHPRMTERGFVLAPLAEIAPGWLHPTLDRTVVQLLEDLRRRADPDDDASEP